MNAPSTAVATKETPQGMMATFERMAMDPSVDVNKLEKLMELAERVNKRTAEEAFNSAMTDAQERMRPVAADANNPQTKSKYASYAALDKALRPIYTGNGFALSFDTGDSPSEMVRVLCYVSHRAGHSRTYKVDMPADGKGAKGGDVMTKTHATGAGMSYGMRYLLKMIFNVAVGEDDRDGNEPVKSVSEDQIATIEAKLAELGGDQGKRKVDLLKWLKVSNYEEIPATSYAAVIEAIQAKIKSGGK